MLIYFDQLLTIRKTAKHHPDSSTLYLPLATLKGLPYIEDMAKRKWERERMRERKMD